MLEIVKRYEKLKLRESLFRENYYHYPSVCKELSFIWRNAYSKVPKNLQSILFQDTLAAFQFFPQVQTRYGMEMQAANLLLQAAKIALPKHKRGLAVTEFKHAVIAYKRRQKVHKDAEGVFLLKSLYCGICSDVDITFYPSSPQLPHDALVHVFGFLDLHSLVVVGLVCRSWSSAANENNLWQSQLYDIYSKRHLIFNIQHKNQTSESEPAQKSASIFNKKDERDLIIIDWKEAFKQEYIGASASNRGYCWICKSVVWISNMKCSNVHYGTNIANQQIKFLSSLQVVEFLLEDPFSIYSSSDSDSDSEESTSDSELWF